MSLQYGDRSPLRQLTVNTTTDTLHLIVDQACCREGCTRLVFFGRARSTNLTDMYIAVLWTAANGGAVCLPTTMP